MRVIRPRPRAASCADSPRVDLGRRALLGRKFIGAELKESYWRQACENLKQAKRVMGDLFVA